MKGYNYIRKKVFNHSRSRSDGTVCLHVLIAEKALGRNLPVNAVVHHVDENIYNNSNNNLVICQDENYHRLLHVRMSAYKACKNTNWRKCSLCKEYDNTDNLLSRANSVSGSIGYMHSDCYYVYRVIKKCSWSREKKKLKLMRRINSTNLTKERVNSIVPDFNLW